MAGPDRLHHRPRPPARRHHRPKRGRHRQDEPDDHALGRSRGGLTTRIHLARDGRGRPLAILVTPGQRHDGVCARPPPERIRVPRTGLGRRRCRPGQVIADKAHSSRGFRACLRRRGIAHTIPEKTDQRRHRLRRGGHGGRPPGFDRETYRRHDLFLTIGHRFGRVELRRLEVETGSALHHIEHIHGGIDHLRTWVISPIPSMLVRTSSPLAR
ncbi:transposase [Streptomyces sp. S465]|uniref:transposase n=1 Tax=Streptomyces sp. S465 TaxID=2979468 RepID=UPI003FCD7EBD